MKLSKHFQLPAGLFVAVSILLPASSTDANFHLWDISEVFSNSDGSVQFIEMFTSSNGQHVTANHSITTNANTWIFPSNTPTPTTNRRLLLATTDFDLLTGGVAPDFIIPSNFFNPAGDTINFVGADSITFASLPTDGVMSLNDPGAVIDTNSPTNFAGASGSVDLSAAPEPSGDYNGNGVVDAADYTQWRDTNGQTVAMAGDGADGNQSGEVDAGDYTYWADRFGNVVPGEGGGSAHLAPGDSPGANLAVVPEPATLVAAIVGALIGMFVARCSRS